MKNTKNAAVIAAEVALIIIIVLFTVRGVLNYLNASDEYDNSNIAQEETNVPDSKSDISDDLSTGSDSPEASDQEQVNPEENGREQVTSEEDTAERLKTDEQADTMQAPADESTGKRLKFRNKKLLNQHYEKHGMDMGFQSASEYEQAASAVAENPDALHKTEKEDGDDVYYLTSTNEFVVVSTDGYIRTYFKPDSGIKYFNKQ